MTETKTSKGSTRKKQAGFSDEERAAMQERSRELKAESRRRGQGGKADAEAEALAKIAELPEPDRAMAERIHAIVKEVAPQLSPRTWYGMPAWAIETGKALLYFTPASKFKERYATLGFNADAQLDDGVMWPTSWALTGLDTDAEARIADLVKRAAG